MILSKTTTKVDFLCKTTEAIVRTINTLSLYFKLVRKLSSSITLIQTKQRTKQSKQRNVLYPFSSFIHKSKPLLKLTVAILLIQYININEPIQLISLILDGQLNLTLF